MLSGGILGLVMRLLWRSEEASGWVGRELKFGWVGLFNG
jgi:hypothetical protein